MRVGTRNVRQRITRAGLASLCLALILMPGCKRADEGNFASLMNRGKAYLENRNAKQAIAVLRKAVDVRPDSTPALRNLARAYRLAVQPQHALDALSRAEKIDANDVATLYLTGLTLARLARFEEARQYLAHAVRLDADTAALRFQLAAALQALGRHDEAREQLRATIRLDPLHASAFYRLSSYARRDGDAEAFQRFFHEFTRLKAMFGDNTRTPRALERCRYAMPEAPPTRVALRAAPSVPELAVRFVDATGEVFADDRDRAASVAAVLAVDQDGTHVVFVAGDDGSAGVMRWGDGGRFRRDVIESTSLGDHVWSACVVGNFHDDVPPGVKYDPKVHAANDVLLVGDDGVRLLKQLVGMRFADATALAGLDALRASSVRWVDAEHDGDLDLLAATQGGARLFQNNGNGRFEDVTDDVGIESTTPAVDVLAVDLDQDVAVDLVVAHGSMPTVVFENRRAGAFARMTEPPGPWPAARRLLANDLNNDGLPDVILVGDSKATVLYGHTPRRDSIGVPGISNLDLALVDFDNDGLLDVLAFGRAAASANRGAVRLFRNVGDSGWQDVSDKTGLASLDIPSVKSAVCADFDRDGDADVLLVTAGDGLRFLRNDGGDANRALKLRLTTIKTNTTGIGTHVELRDRFWRATRTVAGPVIEIGLGPRQHLDAVQTVWTNGVVDNQIDLDVSADPLTIVEKNVAAGSCPFLYAWDGTAFRFVTDILGNAPIDLPRTRTEMLPADPDEIVRIGDASQFQPRDGLYTVVVSDEFREVLYLDHAKLIAVDHPPDVAVYSTDKLMPAPFPTSAVWALRDPIPLVSAVDGDGVDQTAALRDVDGVFAPPGVPLPAPYRGMCHPHSLTLAFESLPSDRPLVLALTGWLQYGDASTNIALSQNPDLTIIPPTLEVETKGGEWRPVALTVGMPAGKTKTILCDLTGRLSAGAHRLRLTTTFEIRWDRIALLTRAGDDAMTVRELLPVSAELAWRGFCEIEQRLPDHPTTPDFDAVSERPAWRTALAGWYTRYGPVTGLVTHHDDRLVILGGGDALTLAFGADEVPPIPTGMTRTWFFYSVGWDKDGDHNVKGGDVVEPLPSSPGRGSGRSTDWRLRYNTRWVPRDRFRPAPPDTTD